MYILATHESSQRSITAAMFACVRTAIEVEPLVDDLAGNEKGALEHGVQSGATAPVLFDLLGGVIFGCRITISLGDGGRVVSIRYECIANARSCCRGRHGN
ncbi:hypothetical protein D3C71_1928050 [compost metagenome]